MIKREVVEKILIQMKILPTRIGFTYITDMVIALDEMGVDAKMMRLYEAVGEKYGKKWKNVERQVYYSIRNANKDSRAWQRVICQDKVSNSEFIHLLWWRLKEER